MMNQVKLVIWDLDETFWKGTLSEGPVEIIPENVEMIRTLVQRGIMCSISSKNDLEPAKAELERACIWDYFIFPVINWNPKGENIKDIISRCQLRAVNVLFIDDNASNRNEAEFYNPGLMTMDAIDLPKLLDDEGLLGKDDSKLSRLEQYKILEQKEVFKTSCSDNTDFLIKSNIRIEYLRDIKTNSTRIAELIARSNQLNFTKIRIDESGVLALADNPNYECAAIHVVDNFGDYGICGFYALDKEKKKLEHFLFSCRILNLGVENYIYQQLGCPALEIVPQVSETIDPTRKIDWIKVVTAEEFERINDKKAKSKKRIYLLGGCDLSQMVHYLDQEFDVVTDFNYVSDKGKVIHREHTCFLRHKDVIKDKLSKDIEILPFLDKNMLDYHYENNYDLMVFSVLMNYNQHIYREKENDVPVAYGGYEWIFETMSSENFTQDELQYFKEHYNDVGHQTPEEFVSDLDWLLSVTSNKWLFINASEIPLDGSELSRQRHERHGYMNSALRDFCAKHSDRCQLLDVCDIIKSPNDYTDSMLHYKRNIYVEMALRIGDLLQEKKIDKMYHRMRQYAKIFVHKIQTVLKLLKIKK